jgi:integrase
MKGEREHRVPLSGAAVRLLQDQGVDPEDSPDEFVFPGAKDGYGLSNMAMLTLLQKRMKQRPYTVHGMRSTARDWGSECTDFSNEVLEMALAHVVDDKTEAAYRRGDLLEKRRQLADAWEKFCTAPPGCAKVLSLGAGPGR